jgi:DNA-damage-inducible protein D
MDEKNLINITEDNFESIKHIDENGIKYWYARELQNVLNYKEWRKFENVINKAKEACENSDISIFDHFVDVAKTIKMPKGAEKTIIDYRLTRYACYLIAQNGDSRKKAIALAQTYFAVQTRKQELTRQEYEQLSEDEKRLYTRKNVKDKNKYLFDTAKLAGVKNYGKFNNYGYRGLYNGETAKDIANRKGISEKEDILDYMSSTELAANLFRITQTDEVLKNKNINNENDACKTHHNVGQAVRQTIKRIGGTMPEDLPTPSKSAKQIEKEKNKELKSNDKKRLK